MLSYLLVALAMLAATVSAQPTCLTDPADQQCSSSYMTTPDGKTAVNLVFLYEPSASNPRQGTICSVSSFSITSNAKGGVNVVETQMAQYGQAPGGEATLTTDGLAVTAASTGSVTLVQAKSPFAKAGSATFSSADLNVASTIEYTNAKGTLQTIAVGPAQTDTCSAPSANGDPHFSGFLGQQFELQGKGGLTYNILSAADMQLNSRLVQLNVGDALTRPEMRTARLKSLFALPNTYWFDHAGPYMGELGVAMLNGHQLYAQAGSYENGFDVVQLDGANVSVSQEAVVLGSVTVSRPSAHQVVLESESVQLTFTNSDHFFNIENAQLKDGFSFQKTPLGGALGQSANAAWVAHDKEATWRKQVEQDALVESNDLFTLSAPAGTVSA